MSSGNFLQVRFKTLPRSRHDANVASNSNVKQFYRGYLLRYKFTRDYGVDVKEGGKMDTTSSDCKIYFHGSLRRYGYFSSPNYPGLYPRDVECHYYFVGDKNQKVQITFHTFDVEGVDQ